MEDLGTGEYVSRFSAVRAGAYQVTVLHGDTNIAGSPFAAVVAPADIDPAASYAIGEGMQTARCGQKVRCMAYTAVAMDQQLQVSPTLK